jgi:hypothetical protein
MRLSLAVFLPVIGREINKSREGCGNRGRLQEKPF